MPGEEQTEVHYPSVTRVRNEYMIREGEASGGIFSSNSNFQDMAFFAVALRNSQYLEPARQLLDEVVCISNAVEPGLNEQMRMVRSIGMTLWTGGSLLRGGTTNPHEEIPLSAEHLVQEEKHDVRCRISKLVALLDELENRYEHYLHQLNGVVSSFEVVAGIGAAAPYTALTVQAMSKHFSNLRDLIIAQINSSKEILSEDSPRNHEHGVISLNRLFDQSSNSRQKREILQHNTMEERRPAWRLIRGLPEDSVVILRAWLFQHFLHPYPNDNEKLMLASQTGLNRNQISNWFINARVRLWKPMIEEMYREEFAEDPPGSDPSA